MRKLVSVLLLFPALSGCAVVAVADAAVSVTAGVVGLAADAAIGTVKIVGKGVGKTVDAVLGDDEDDSDSRENAEAEK